MESAIVTFVCMSLSAVATSRIYILCSSSSFLVLSSAAVILNPQWRQNLLKIGWSSVNFLGEMLGANKITLDTNVK